MQGKIVLITGATSGIGAVAAGEIAAKGARILLIGRDPVKIAATVDDIRARTGNAQVEGLRGDLSSFAEVRRLADEVRTRTDRLDVLVNNAGGVFSKRELSVDGIEKTFALNHLSYFLMTTLLLDLLRRSASARVVSVASDAHNMTRGVDEANLRGERGYAGWRAYGQSKLANIQFASELARRLDGSGVTSNSLHPGFVRTGFFGKPGLGPAIGRLAANLFAITPEEGAKTTIHLATSPEVEGVTGAYFVKSRPARPSGPARDEAAARRLWELSERIVGRQG